MKKILLLFFVPVFVFTISGCASFMLAYSTAQLENTQDEFDKTFQSKIGILDYEAVVKIFGIPDRTMKLGNKIFVEWINHFRVGDKITCSFNNSDNLLASFAYMR